MAVYQLVSIILSKWKKVWVMDYGYPRSNTFHTFHTFPS